MQRARRHPQRAVRPARRRQAQRRPRNRTRRPRPRRRRRPRRALHLPHRRAPRRKRERSPRAAKRAAEPARVAARRQRSKRARRAPRQRHRDPCDRKESRWTGAPLGVRRRAARSDARRDRLSRDRTRKLHRARRLPPRGTRAPRGALSAPLARPHVVFGRHRTSRSRVLARAPCLPRGGAGTVSFGPFVLWHQWGRRAPRAAPHRVFAREPHANRGPGARRNGGAWSAARDREHQLLLAAGARRDGGAGFPLGAV